jgi:hypothetical protein
MQTHPNITKGLVVGIVLGFFGLCIIPATALKNGEPSQISISDNRWFIGENELSYSSQIHLLKRQLPLLIHAMNSLNGTFYKPLLQQIRYTLEQKGSLDTNDLEKIAAALNITNVSFYCGYMTARGETGFATVWPFTVFAMLIYSRMNFYIGPMCIGMWFTDWESSNHNWEGVSFSINGREVFQGATSGIAFGGFGVFYRMSFEKPEFDFVGLFPLIIVNKNPI